MNCKNCGSELQDGAVFCQSCGAKVDEPVSEAAAAPQETDKAAEQAPQEMPKAEESKAEEPKAEEPKAEAPKAEEAPAAQEAPKAEEAPAAQEAPKAEKAPAGKKKGLFFGLIAAAAVIVIALCVVLAVKVLPGLGGNKNESSNAVAFISKDTLCVILDTTVKEPKILEVCDIDIDDSISVPSGIVRWTEDEKYIYFFNDVKDNGTGDLCRIQISKLGKDKDKNESKVQEIDDNIYYTSLIILDNGDLFYVTGKDKLMFYSGKESQEIRRDVVFPGVNNNEKGLINDKKGLVYLGDEEDGSYTLFYLDIAKLEETEIDDEVTGIWSARNNEVYYNKTNTETWNTEMYVADYSSFNPTEISDNIVTRGTVTDGGFYYTETEEYTVNLYDYIKDPYADSDEDAVEPDYPDTSAGFVDANVEDVFDEDKMEFINDRFDGNRIEYMDSYCWTYDYGDETYYRISNYDTDKDYYYCISKDKYYEYDSEIYDQAVEKYYEDRDNWYLIRDRIYLRDSLINYEVELSSSTLYYFHDGKSEEIVTDCGDVDFVYSSSAVPAAIYSLTDLDNIEKLSIDEISGAYDAYDRLFGYSSGEFGNLYFAMGSDTGRSLEVAGEVNSISYSEKDNRLAVSVNILDKKDTIVREVYLYSVKGTEITLDDKFDDEADCVAAFKDGVVYFIKGSEDGEGDLYIYDGKDNTKVIKNITLRDYGYVYENGSIIAGKDGKYTLYDKTGNEIVKLGEIASVRIDVNRISDKKITFLSEGKLRYYNGKEIIKIAGNVDRVWFANNGTATYLSY